MHGLLGHGYERSGLGEFAVRFGNIVFDLVLRVNQILPCLLAQEMALADHLFVGEKVLDIPFELRPDERVVVREKQVAGLVGIPGHKANVRQIALLGCPDRLLSFDFRQARDFDVVVGRGSI